MSEVMNVAEIFGKNVFNETVMKERLPKSVFKKMKKTIEDGAELDPSIADCGCFPDVAGGGLEYAATGYV